MAQDLAGSYSLESKADLLPDRAMSRSFGNAEAAGKFYQWCHKNG